jgi:hypothetical protein
MTMLVILSKTYNGKEGLYVGGQPHEMTKTKLAMIQEDCGSRKETIEYRVVVKDQPINRPAKQQGSPKDKQVKGSETK